MDQGMEIDLMQLVRIIFRKWILIGFITIAMGSVATLYAYNMLDDVYIAESSMIVQVTSSGDSDYTNLLTGQRLVDTYKEFTESNLVLDELRSNLDINYSNSALREMISVVGVNSTSIIKLSVTSSDRVLAKEIANELVLIVKDLSREFEGLEDVEVLDTASIPTAPSGPNRMQYTIMGVLLGGMIGVGFVILIEVLDKNIKYGKDVERILGIRLLGLIPDYDMKEGGK